MNQSQKNDLAAPNISGFFTVNLRLTSTIFDLNVEHYVRKQEI